jgi:hypothetical protein
MVPLALVALLVPAVVIVGALVLVAILVRDA